MSEKLFQAQHSREKDGRYIEPTTWRLEKIRVGNSFNKAV